MIRRGKRLWLSRMGEGEAERHEIRLEEKHVRNLDLILGSHWRV